MTHEERKNKLSPLQQKFVEEYMKDPSDGGAAYMRAAPNCATKKSASVQASKLLAMDKVQNAMKDNARSILGFLEARIIQNVEFWLEIRDSSSPGANQGELISKEKVLHIIAKHKGEKVLKEIDLLAKYEIKLNRTADRMKASEYLGKYMQMFIEKKEIDLTAQVQIVDDIK